VNTKFQQSGEQPIVVGVNGSSGSEAAVLYAVDEARRIGCDLRLVHVAPRYLPAGGLVPPAGGPSFKEFEAIGHSILKTSAKPAYEALSRNRVSTVLEFGSRSLGVLRATDGARLLVVGDDRTPLLERLAVGSFIAALAAKAMVPLVSVPSDWTRGSRPDEDARVVLGIKDPQRVPVELLRAGFQAAADRNAVLEVAHVWEMPPGYAALMTSLEDGRTWQTSIERSVRALVDPLRQEFPDVSYTTESRYGQPAQILRERAQGAVLLMLARRPHGFPFGYFGSTGRALLREAPCPVEVVPVAERAADAAIRSRRPSTDRPALAATNH